MSADLKSARGRPAPKINLSPLEWRLTITTVLAGAYIVAWFAVTRPQARRSTPTAATSQPAVTRPPIEERISPAPRVASAPRITRVSPQRVQRIRTRSS